jgi:hypothetical protein
MKITLPVHSCTTCAFRSGKWCNLKEHTDKIGLLVINESRDGKVHTDCPLRSSDILFTLQDYGASNE